MSDELDITTAGGYGLAALTLQHALLAQLTLKGVLTMNEAAAIATSAAETVHSVVGDAPDDAATAARECLNAIAHNWTRAAAGN